MQRVRNQIQATKQVCGQLTGKGVLIGVLDTGIGRHPDLAGRIWEFRDFVNAKAYPYDDSGHGTHVCGIMCGNGRLSGGRYAGMAPEAGLVMGKVLDRHGDGSAEDMLMGLRWIERYCQHHKLRILNISIGIADLKDAYKEQLLTDALERLWDMGVTVICAAGNKGPGNGTISTIGESNKLITVGCHDGIYCKYNPRRCENYSGRGKALSRIRKPDIVAPGTDIMSCNCFFSMQNGRIADGYVTKSGTSMATPIIAGAAALFYEKYPYLTNEDFKKKLTMTATDLGEPWNKQGWGMINMQQLLD